MDESYFAVCVAVDLGCVLSSKCMNWRQWREPADFKIISALDLMFSTSDIKNWNPRSHFQTAHPSVTREINCAHYCFCPYIRQAAWTGQYKHHLQRFDVVSIFVCTKKKKSACTYLLLFIKQRICLMDCLLILHHLSQCGISVFGITYDNKWPKR